MRLEEGEGEEAAHAEADQVDDEAPLHPVARAPVVVALRALVTPLLRLTWLARVRLRVRVRSRVRVRVG